MATEESHGGSSTQNRAVRKEERWRWIFKPGMIVLRREQTRPCRLASVMAVMDHDKHRLFLSMPFSKHFLDPQTLSTPLEHCNPSTHLSEVMSRSLLRVDSFYGDQRLVGPRVSLSTFVPEDAAFHVETKGWRQLGMICEEVDVDLPRL